MSKKGLLEIVLRLDAHLSHEQLTEVLQEEVYIYEGIARKWLHHIATT